MKEDIKTEFKREYTDEIKKTIVAFANTEGGVLYIGINDDGSVFGIDDTDKTVLQITSALRDTIRPDVSSLTKISVESCDKKTLSSFGFKEELQDLIIYRRKVFAPKAFTFGMALPASRHQKPLLLK